MEGPALSALPCPWWGEGIPYGDAWARQRSIREAVIAGEGGEQLALLTHRPVVTTGRRVAPGTPSKEALAAAGIERFETDRGGLATWHGPGQLVGYLILDAGGRGLRVRDVVCAIEAGLIGWLAERGVAAGRRDGLPGVWVGREKIAALGLHFKRGVSNHGFALNLTCDLQGFGQIVPCGIQDGGVTTLAALLGAAPTPAEAAPSVGSAVREALSTRCGGARAERTAPRA